ncbi:MAG TPA: Xaa-Pro dipeptidyl-peptidase [Thermoleophilaceae bacterium]|nr:Xaa-Pro dipeptidyl-peptidase [Thermoleophilaceae bacterium]
MTSRTGLRLVIGAVAAFAAIALPAAPAAGAEPSPPPWLKVEDGVTQPQFAAANAIEEVVFVESEVDSDGDGARDRIRIRISRPGETESQGIKVPVVFEHSPYRGDLGGLPNHPVDVDRMPQESEGGDARAAASRQSARSARAKARARARARLIPDLPGSLDNYYVPRGYAVVLGESIGTFNSDGCPDVGASGETLGTKAVIDWLNGRARGWNGAGERVRADWTTGAVGMIGVSYNGTLPNQVATTGVEGLETIVPISAISSWYDYYRANGLVRAPHSQTQGAGENAFQGEDTDVLAAFTGGPRMTGECADMMTYLNREQDRVTGDWSPFWQARDYLSRVRGVESSVFVVHGLNDWNVMTKAFAEWWYRLADRRVARKLWLHNGGHGGESQSDAADFAVYKRTENRWFDHELFGVRNGIFSEPRSSIEREEGNYVHEADWPLPGARQARLRLSAGSSTAPGELSTRSRGRSRDQSFVDRGRELDTDDVLIQSPDTAHPNRLIYRSPSLRGDVRISGTPRVSLRMSIDNRTAANLTAVLVDYGPAGGSQAPLMVTRGWMDPQNRSSLSRSERVRQGREYRFRWDLQPDDYVFKAGHRIGLVVVSTDFDYTLRPLPGTRLTLDPDDSEVTLPVVGGSSALGF